MSEGKSAATPQTVPDYDAAMKWLDKQFPYPAGPRAMTWAEIIACLALYKSENSVAAPKAGEPPQELSNWLDTTLWSFVHGALLDLGVCTGRESNTEAHDSLHKHMRGAILAALQVGAGETPAERWIPVAKIPNTPELVLGFVPPNIIGLCFYRHGVWKFPDEDKDREAVGITHWMPIYSVPLPPGAGSTKENV